jgi:DNA-binding MarR family transcriptional regulator
MKTTLPNEQTEKLCLVLQKISRCCERRRPLVLECAELSPAECEALACFGRSDKVTPEALSKTVAVTRSRVTRILDSLEKKKLITRSPSDGDKRAVEVLLTKQGRERFMAAKSAQLAEARVILEKIPAKDRQMVLEAVEILQTVMAESK